MKIVAMIARLLLGLVFFVFGLNHYLNFIPPPPQMPAGPVGQFMEAMMTTHYMWVVAFFEVVPGILLLVNRYVPLALTFLGPVIFNIVLVDILMMHQGLPVGVVITILWLVVFYQHRSAFAGLFAQRA